MEKLKLEVVKISDVVTSPWDQLESPRWAGYQYGVAHDVRKTDRRDPSRPRFNAYEATWEFLAVCTTAESAQAAKRLLDT